MLYPLTDVQHRDIKRKLPPEIALLKDDHPVAIALVADYCDAPPFPTGYQPKLIEIYFDELADGPGILYRQDRGLTFDFDFYKPNSPVFLMDVDHQVAYVRLGSLVLLNRIDGIVLPDVPPEIAIDMPAVEL